MGKPLQGALVGGQSGGPTPVINASLAGVIGQAQRHGWLVSGGFAAATAVVAYYLFQVWLKIPMPRTIFGF